MILFDLLYNLSALLAISVLSGFIDLRWSRFDWLGKLLQGLLFGVAAIVGMMYPFVLTEGIIFDGRSVVISLAAAFFGPVSGIIAAGIAMIYRFFIVGGSGWLTGILVISASFLIGWGFYLYRKHKKLQKFSLIQLYLLGLTVHFVMLLLMFTLPDAYQIEALQLLSLTVLGIYPLVSLLIGKILSDQELNKRLIQSLKESEEQYRMLVTHQSDLVVKVDAANKLKYVSPSYCRLFSKTEEDLLGKNFMPLIHEDDRQSTIDAMENLKKPPYTAYIEQRVATPKGYRWLAWSDQAIVDDNGNIEAVIGVGRDITARKNAEIDRQRSEKRYRHLFNASPVGIILEDVEGLILEVNQTLCNDYGYEPHELIGQNITFLVPEQNRQQVKVNLQKIISQKMLHSIVKGKTKQNKPKILELIETAITLPDGNLGILSIAKDITEQERIKERLKETQIRNAAIISAIPDRMFTIKDDGLIVDVVSNQEEEHLTLTEKDFLNKQIDKVVPRHMSKLVKKNLKAAFETGDLVAFEYAMGMGKQQMWYDIRMIKSSEDEVLAIVRDISHRKQQELELQHQKRFIETLLNSIPNPLFYMDRKGYYLGINSAFQEFYGIKKKDIIGKNIFDLSFEQDAANRHKSDMAIFDGRESRQVVEREIKLNDGSIKNAIILKSPFPDSEGEIGGLIGVIVDISDRKLMEEELRTAKDRAEESDRLKTAFLNNLSHEIRTPMNAIIGFSDLLGLGYPPEQQKSFIATINNNAEQLLHIIDDVLAVARLDAEKMPLDKELFEVNALLQDLFNTFEPEAKKKQLKLLLESSTASAATYVEGDKIKIRQVIAGFISNALKYTPEGEIRFGWERLKPHVLRFYVSDTGFGIDETDKEKVFERFFRGTDVQLKAIRGNGLGLSIAKGLVELMGGTIGLNSEKGKGTDFYFEIPVKITNDQIGLAENQPSLSGSFKVNKLLVAEDEEDNYLLIADSIQDYYQQIAWARNGKEAVEMAAANSYDLILMDLKMPLMNGEEACRLIKEQQPDLPIIAVSAYTQIQGEKDAMEAGFNAYLEKPFQIGHLIKLIAQFAG